MAWFKVDDGFYSHTKVLLIPRSVRAAAIGTWTLCGTWSADKLKDGYVPAFMVEELGGTIEAADALVQVKLWRKRGDGYQFINWTEFQPSREKVLEQREKERLRKQGYRAAHPHDSKGKSGNVPTGQKRNPNTPTRPVPTTSSNEEVNPSAAKSPRGTRIPEPFIVTREMREWAALEVPGVDVDAESRSFVDYWRGRAGVGATKVDWVATWRNSMRRAVQIGKPRTTAAQKNLQTVAYFAQQQKAIE